VICMYSTEFKDLLAKLRPVIGEMADAFWLATLLDPSQEKDVHAVAQALAAELLDESYIGRNILLEPPPRDKVKGEYPLGTVTYANKPICPFGLLDSDLPQHVAILGRSGAGKTNVGYLLVWNLLRAGKPFIVLDWRGTYKHFLCRPEGKEIMLFNLGDDKSLSFNPLDPPPTLTKNQAQAYLRDIVSVITTTYLPGHHLLSTRGVEYFFLKALDLPGATGDKPITFNDIRNYMQRYPADSREKDWKVSALNILFKLTTGPVGWLMNSAGAFTVADILDKPVVLELTALGSETDRSVFTQTLLLWLYYNRLAEGKSQTFKHAILIEEAHNLFLKRPNSVQSVHDLMLRQMRELGESLVLLDQNPSLLTVPALGNTGVTICLNLKHGDDVEAAGKAMTLPRENWDYIGRLPVGRGIVKLQDRWMKPFLVRFPQFPISSPVHRPKVKRRDSGSDSVKQAIEELRSALNEAISALPQQDRREKEISEIATREGDLLVDVAKHPLAVVTERYARLGWNARTGTEIKRTLLERGLIEQERVSVPNGSVSLLKVTKKGQELLIRSEGMEVKALPKNASLEHEYHKELVARRYRNMGYDVQKEVQIGEGKAVDLVATKGNRRVAIEIETGKSNVQNNVTKCNKCGFDDVVVLSTTHKQSKTYS